MCSQSELEPKTPYDELAKHYRALCETRAPYLDAIEQIVIGSIGESVESLLDVGAGDGHRAMRIARAKRISKVVLADPSKEMLKLCETYSDAILWLGKAQDLPNNGDQFSVITCLWNVLGHVENYNERLRALRNMRSLLQDDGVIFLDVNNRYNATNYGFLNTFGRVIRDLIAPSEKNGDTRVTWRVRGQTIHSPGHVFTPGELASLFCAAKLGVQQRLVVDYRSGKTRRSILAGQFLFELRKL